MKKFIFILSIFFLCGQVRAETIDSLYTPLEGKTCRKLDDYSVRCPGVRGFHLDVLDDDNRMSIDVITPSDKKIPLNFWHIVTGAFSHLGKVAEWRVVREKGVVRPIALIVRVYLDGSEEGQKRGSRLAVIKLTATDACITHVIDGGSSGANAAARDLASKAAEASCLTDFVP